MKNIAVVRSVKIAVKNAVLVIYQIIKIRFYMKRYVILYIFSIISYHTYNNTAARNLKLKRQYQPPPLPETQSISSGPRKGDLVRITK